MKVGIIIVDILQKGLPSVQIMDFIQKNMSATVKIMVLNKVFHCSRSLFANIVK